MSMLAILSTILSGCKIPLKRTEFSLKRITSSQTLQESDRLSSISRILLFLSVSKCMTLSKRELKKTILRVCRFGKLFKRQGSSHVAPPNLFLIDGNF